jgi:hypothetical protein
MQRIKVEKIISGGQTGADRAGLEAAKILKIATGGYCPNGYLTETGADISLKKFKLKESVTSNYEERTFLNVKSGEGTVIFCKLNEYGEICGEGTKLTLHAAVLNNKPVIINPTKIKFLKWLDENKIKVLNVAGNRESQYPGIFKKTKSFLIKALSDNE